MMAMQASAFVKMAIVKKLLVLNYCDLLHKRILYRLNLGSKKRDNVWLGVTVEDSASMWRTGHLKGYANLCALLFISAEPLLEQISLNLNDIGWLIIGGESGSKNRVRKMDLDWAVDLIDQANNANVPCFYKQHGPKLAKELGESKNGSDPANWNANDPWNIREFPLMVEADYFDYCDCDECQSARLKRNIEAMKSAGVAGKLVWKPVYGRAIHQQIASSVYAGVHIPVAYEVR